jgi:flagellar hook-length control protein FliK
VQTLLRRVEVTKVLSAAGAIAEPASAARADGLPPASYGNAPNAPAAPTVTVPGPPVDVRTPHWHETFAHRVQWLASNHVDEVHIKLNPPELGAVDVKISLVDDKTFVQLTAATSAARDELAQNLPRLRELFTLSGLELGGASVHNGRDGHYAGHGQRPAAPSASTAAAYPDDGGAQLDPMPRRAVGRIDVFA